MKILIPVIGSRGDIQPFIALAQQLILAGHTVTIASHPLMKTLVENHGVGFRPIGPDIDLAREVSKILQDSRSSIAGLIRGMRFSFDILQRSHNDILPLCQDADLVIISAQSAAGKNEADMEDIPYLSVTLMPWAVPWDDPTRPFLKRAIYKLVDKLASLITTRPLNNIRKELGLPPVGEEGFTSLRLNLIPVSQAVYPPNPQWEARHKAVGYWFADTPENWEPSQDLLRFINESDPPVLISLGAMGMGEKNAEGTARLFVEVLRQHGFSAIIQGMQNVLGRLKLPGNVYAAGSIPHSWLLPRCRAIIHHGGYGTTAAGLRAGIPALVIPHIADQFYWANIIHDLGAGPKPIPRSKLASVILSESFSELVNNLSLRETASELGNRIRSEKGTEKAIQIIHEVFG